MIVFVLILSGCGEPLRVDSGAGLPDQVYQGTPVYSGRINSVGTLTEGYIQNTESLLTANNRLRTLCIAYGKCKTE